ncbi:hypothetical protein GCM10022229_07190 [Luteimonas lutimaris]|uniref:Transposase n=1 Tax=Luteimonas lutimaris TaxID=698645 RepID=A0ABP7MB04_9GAMM
MALLDSTALRHDAFVLSAFIRAIRGKNYFAGSRGTQPLADARSSPVGKNLKLAPRTAQSMKISHAATAIRAKPAQWFHFSDCPR